MCADVNDVRSAKFDTFNTKQAILANEPRPQKALQLQKAHDILNIGDRLREERDAEMKAAKEKAVKEATYEQKKIAAQQFKELRKYVCMVRFMVHAHQFVRRVIVICN